MSDTADPDDLVSVPAAAAILGVSDSTMRDLLRRGRLPYTRPSVHPRVRVGDVLAYQAKVTRRRGERKRLPAFEDVLAD
jgi:excisionase family DNA binding protein